MSTTYSAIYSFGDSLSDAGDAYLLTSSDYGAALGLSPEPVSPPYAQETYSGTKADVFSNGPIWVQDLATALGVATPAPGQVGATGTQLIAAGAPALVVAALDGGNSSKYVTFTPGAPGGTDFAIGGSVTGPTDFNTGGASALTDLQSQIANFQHEITTPAADALYTVWSGSNDLLNLLSSSAFASQSTATSQAEVAQSAQNEVDAVITLVQAGAKNVLVGNVPNLGLIPAVTTQGTAASQAATAYAQYFNTTLQADLQAAAPQLGGAAVNILDTFSLLSTTTPGTVVSGPNGNTITDTTDSAYTGSLTADNGTVASNANNYLYFDMMHPTQTGHQAIANLAAADLAPTQAPTPTPVPTMPARTVDLQPFDIVSNRRQGNTTFVFSQGDGLDVIRGFKLGGADHDTIALPSTDFRNFAAVLRNTGDIQGSAFITDPKTGDAIRLAGVTTAELKQHPKDFAFV